MRGAPLTQRWLEALFASGRRACLATVLTLALALAPWQLRAAPEPATASVEFRWDAPADRCPDEASVTAELERLLGGPVGEQGRGRLVAIARVRQQVDGQWDLRLWTVTDETTRQRSLTGADCAVLAEAAALLAAMAIDPDVLTRASDAALEHAEQAEDIAPDAASEPQPEPEPEPEPEPQPEPEPEVTRPTRAYRVALGINAGASLADLPGVGPVLRAHGALQWDRLRLGLAVHYAFVRRARRQGNAERGADLQHATAILSACAVLHHRPANLEFPLCACLEAGALVGTGVGFATTAEGAVPWLAVDLAPGIVWHPLPRLAVGLSIEPWLALLRGRLLVDDGSELWRPRWVGIRALAGIETRF